jgi:PAS domain S-box-containing protein
MTNDSLERPPGRPASGVDRLRALRDLAALARRNVTGRELRDAIIDAGERLFHPDAMALWRYETREHIWRIAASSGLSSDYSAVGASAESRDASAMLTEPLFIDDLSAWPQVDQRRALYDSEHIVAFLLIPLNIRGETAGTICCYFREKTTLSSEDLSTAAVFGEIVSLALSTERFDELAEVARDVAGRLDLDAVVQRITDAATKLTGAEFGAFFYNVTDDAGESYMLYAISGVPREAFSRFPMPRNTAVFSPTFAGTGVVRSANIHEDPRYGKNEPYHGMPAGHLPVVSYLAVPVTSRAGEVLGGLFFGHSTPAIFGESEEKIALALAGHAATAVDNARTYARLERERAAFRKNEIRYRSLVLATPTRQALFVTTPAGTLAEDSPSWREITGQTEEEIKDRGWLTAIHPDHRALVQAARDESIRNTTPMEVEYMLRVRDGSYRWFAGKSVPVVDTDGVVMEWVGTATDVHEQHVANEGLRFLARANEIFASSLDYRKTLKNVTHLAVPQIADWCALDMVGDDGTLERLAVAHVDPAKVALAAEFRRRYPTNPETDGVLRVMRTGQAELVREIPEELLLSATIDAEHLRLIRELGIMSYMIVPLRSRGTAAGAITFVASERRFTDQDLVHAEELAHRASIAIENARLYGAAQSANRAKDEFLATLSHELRTPMTAVLGWARMLKMGLSEAEAEIAIDAIEQSASAQAQLIEDVLDVSRIMAGKLTFDPHPIDLSTVAHAAITTVHPAASAKGIEILTSIPPLLPTISGDEGRLQQVVWNLLANAIKFTPRGGAVTLRIVHVGSIVRLTVSDTGEGIEPSFLPHVFEAFRQADSSTTRVHGGIGLGLAIVRSLIELHGGRITVASEGVGRGATFSVEIPVLEQPSSTTGRPRAADPSPSGRNRTTLPSLVGLTVLVIDDQEYTRDMVSAVLRRANAVVYSASSVREGLESFNNVHPHVVVCDIAMPNEDGYVFVQEVRAMSGDVRRTPILALTAFGRPEDRTNALNAGFDAYLKKPVDPVELAQTIQRLTTGR